MKIRKNVLLRRKEKVIMMTSMIRIRRKKMMKMT